MAVVIGSKYCNAKPTDIGVVTSVLPIGENHFLVTDNNNDIIFRVDDSSTSFHKQRNLVDSEGTIIATFRYKSASPFVWWPIYPHNPIFITLPITINMQVGMSAHHRCQVFKGESTDKKDIIFNAKRCSMIHSSSDINIYFPKNEDEKVCDYRVDSSFVFYKGDSDNNVIAEAKEHMVKMRANVDSAFIVSLIVILDGISEQEAENKAIGKALLKGGAKAGNAL